MSGQWQPADPLLLEFAGEEFDVEARATDILRQGDFLHTLYTPLGCPTLSRNPAMDTFCPTEPLCPREDTLILQRL